MTRSIIRVGIPLIGGTVVSLAVFACSSDGDNKKTDDVTDAGAGGAQTGGASNTGGARAGATGSGGASGGAGGGAAGAPADPYNCEKLPPRDPGGTGAADSECCDVAGVKYGTCVPEASITDPLQRSAFGYDTCDDTANLKCAPTAAALADAGALGVFESCTWTVGTRALEGRCLPKCFINGNPAASQLEQSDCAVNLVCAPCYNPIDGSETGACEFNAGDAPVNPAPTPFAPCGDTDAGPGGGLCVPSALAMASGNPAAAGLPQLTCPAEEVCAPAVKVRDIQGCFPHCTITEPTVAGLGYTQGGCVPRYVVAATNPAGAGLLLQETCEPGEQCAPCINPLMAPEPTGACE